MAEAQRPIPAGTSTRPSFGDDRPWYQRMSVGLEYGPTGANDGDSVYMAGVTGREIIENVARAKAEYVVDPVCMYQWAASSSKVNGGNPCCWQSRTATV